MSRDRAYRRGQRQRKIETRVAKALVVDPWRYADPDNLGPAIEPGRNANENWPLGCHRANCQLCEFDPAPSRAAARREALRHEERAF